MNIAWENDLLRQFLDAHAESHENEKGAQGSVFGYLAPDLLAPPGVPAPKPSRAQTFALQPAPRGPAASARPNPVATGRTN